MSKKGMTLDNTARIDQSVRAGKVWKSPASSKPTYVVTVTTPAAGTNEVHIPLQGEFRVLDAWYLKLGVASNPGDVIAVYKGKPSGSGAAIWSDAAGAAANAVVRTDVMDRTKVAGVGDLGDNADTTGLWVSADDSAGGGDVSAQVSVLVQLDA
jgi:hypothetical protein